MAKLLLVVEDAFDISAFGGLVVVPGPLQAEFEGPRKLAVTLKAPDGAEKGATLSLEHMVQSPPPNECRWLCLFRGLTKADVQIGTEVWVDD